MKKINELTEKEILALSDEQIEVMIKTAIAENGIPFVKKPVFEAKKEVKSPDLKLYTCGLFGNDLAFYSIDDLIEVLNLIKTSNKVSLKDEYSLKSIVEKKELTSRDYHLTPFQITTKDAYSTTLFDDVKSVMKGNEDGESKYEKEQKNYKEYLSTTNEISSIILDKVREVTNKYDEMNYHLRVFTADYVKLADGNLNIAMKFLKKAYTINKEEEDYILNEFNLLVKRI